VNTTPIKNRPVGHCGYGHDDLQLATTEASDGAAEAGGGNQAHQRVAGRARHHEVHLGPRAGGLLGGGL